ncbi:hypothetical protein J6590_098291 [Homalodisca vitripennis]|nr:hypothetical protein J6590_098291 [Homalodisca vitripennis]
MPLTTGTGPGYLTQEIRGPEIHAVQHSVALQTLSGGRGAASSGEPDTTTRLLLAGIHSLTIVLSLAHSVL